MPLTAISTLVSTLASTYDGDRPPGAPRPLSRVAIATLASEVDRHPGPRRILLIGDDTGLVEHLLDRLTAQDTLTVLATDPLAVVTVQAHVDARPGPITERVTVLDELPDDITELAADYVVVAVPVPSEEDLPGDVKAVRALAADGAHLSIAVHTNLSGVRTESFDDSTLLRDDLVLRNNPPLRVYHLRCGTTHADADLVTAERLAPAYRPSSVPLTTRMGIDSNGVVAAGILGGAALLTKLVRPRSRAWLLPALTALPVAAFFRDPSRDVPTGDDAVVAASDGRVLAVESKHDERFGDHEWLRIAVFLSVLDVHVNRSPAAGRVTRIVHEEGGYAMAQSASAEHNVAQYTQIDTVRGPVVVAQRTGLIARRIVNRARVGALVAKGERFGLIRFGSRTDIYLPADAAQACVEVGDRVVGGETIMARWH